MIEHYAHNVPGWFGLDDFEFYKFSVANAPFTAHFVEVGSFKGRSSSFMAVEIVQSNKNIRFDCVDTWMGSEEHQAGQGFEDADVVRGSLYEAFLANMEPVKGHFNPIKLDSIQASALYRDQSLDWVFIDASHDYHSVLADIKCWMPKVKQGGIISGHDYHHPPIKQAVAETVGSVDAIGNCWYAMLK